MITDDKLRQILCGRPSVMINQEIWHPLQYTMDTELPLNNKAWDSIIGQIQENIEMVAQTLHKELQDEQEYEIVL